MGTRHNPIRIIDKHIRNVHLQIAAAIGNQTNLLEVL